jgi:hypothetical protein
MLDNFLPYFVLCETKKKKKHKLSPTESKNCSTFSHKRDDGNQVRSARLRWLKWRRVLKKKKKPGPCCPAAGPDGRTETTKREGFVGEIVGGASFKKTIDWNERGSVSSSLSFSF